MGWPLARKAHQNFGFPYNISAMAGVSDFKFGAQLGFVKAHHKTTPRGKSGGVLGLGELLEIWSFPFNLSATAKDSDFIFGTQLGFAKAHHKITHRGKSGYGLGLEELPKIVGFPIIFLQRLGLATLNLARR